VTLRACAPVSSPPPCSLRG